MKGRVDCAKNNKNWNILQGKNVFLEKLKIEFYSFLPISKYSLKNFSQSSTEFNFRTFLKREKEKEKLSSGCGAVGRQPPPKSAILSSNPVFGKFHLVLTALKSGIERKDEIKKERDRELSNISRYLPCISRYLPCISRYLTFTLSYITCALGSYIDTEMMIKWQSDNKSTNVHKRTRPRMS